LYFGSAAEASPLVTEDHRHVSRTNPMATQLRFRRRRIAMIEFVEPDGLLHNSTFSQVAISSGSRTVYTSGQVAIDEDGNTVGIGDLAEQTRQAMSNLKLALEAAGASFKDVVKMTNFVAGYHPDQREVITGTKEPFYEGLTPPTSALIGVQALAKADWLIEIEAVAVLN
jgi:enamine deaminase RidA (YjgF/YER057c/UK114 family)